MRLFIAIQLSEEMRAAVARIQDEFRGRGVTGNFTPVENLHLTLAFIGEYADSDAVLDVIDGVNLRPFPIALEGVGAFGDLWWVGMKRSEPLEACARRLRHGLSNVGIPFDRKRFSPHITLIRRAEREGSAQMPGIDVPNVEMRVERLSLMRSDRGRYGMIYTEIR